MKNFILAILFAFTAIVFSSCKKESSNIAVVQTGTIRFTNNSNGGYRYEIFKDGTSLGLLSAGYYYDATSVPVGSHVVRALQYEGYVLYPTNVENTVTVSAGETIDFVFP